MTTTVVPWPSASYTYDIKFVYLPKISVDDSIRETFPTDPNTLQHTIASELMHNEERVHNAGLFVAVGHNATDKAWLSRHQHVDEIVQLILLL